MNRQEKTEVVSELRDRFSRASVALIAQNEGLSVEEATQLRRNIREVGGEMRVAKHTLTRIALSDTAFASIEELLVGPRGLVFGFDDPVAVAKALVDFAEDHDRLVLPGGAVEGELIGEEGVKGLSKMADLSTLRAGLVSQALGPATRLASQMASPATRIAGAIAALVEKLEKEGGGAS